MDLGRNLVASALREKTLRPFIDAGLTGEWLTDADDVSRVAVFDTESLAAWRTLTGYWDKHGKVPSVEIFQRSHPAEAYPLPDSDDSPAELIDQALADRRRYLTHLAASDFADIIGSGRVDDAIEFADRAIRAIKKTYARTGTAFTWDSPEYDFEARIHREVRRGVMTGIPGLDRQFHGYQPGNLICYLGRAKAAKSSCALLSAMNAWEEGKNVLFVTFEIAGKQPHEPGIGDRLDCFGANIDLIHYMMGELTRDEQKKLRKFRETCSDSAFSIVQPDGRYTVADLESDIEMYHPDVVYLDGFYFMTDPETGKSGANWEAHDNIASGIKRIAMSRMIPVVITHQVREKQLTGTKGKGIDDGAMMGGTGIIMFADMVLGFDVNDDKLYTVSCTRSRLRYLDTVHGNWNWSTCTFAECAVPSVDEGKFGYGEDGGDAPV